MVKKSQILLFVNMKVKVRSGCVPDRDFHGTLSPFHADRNFVCGVLSHFAMDTLVDAL